MLKTDRAAPGLVALCAALGGDPRQTRPGPRAVLSAYAAALASRDSTPREDVGILMHLEAGLLLAFQTRAPKPAPPPPPKRSHHKKRLPA